MPEMYICTGCYETEGQDENGDYCDICSSYKYFAWVDVDFDEYAPYGFDEDSDEDV